MAERQGEAIPRGAMHQAHIYAALTEKNRAAFHKDCKTCGAKPKEWCDQRLGSICAGRGA